MSEAMNKLMEKIECEQLQVFEKSCKIVNFEWNTNLQKNYEHDAILWKDKTQLCDQSNSRNKGTTKNYFLFSG